MTTSRKSPTPIVRNDLVDEQVNKLFEFVAEISEEFAPESGDVRPTPDFTELVKQNFRKYFEDEVIPAIPSPAGA